MRIMSGPVCLRYSFFEIQLRMQDKSGFGLPRKATQSGASHVPEGPVGAVLLKLTLVPFGTVLKDLATLVTIEAFQPCGSSGHAISYLLHRGSH